MEVAHSAQLEVLGCVYMKYNLEFWLHSAHFENGYSAPSAVWSIY